MRYQDEIHARLIDSLDVSVSPEVVGRAELVDPDGNTTKLVVTIVRKMDDFILNVDAGKRIEQGGLLLIRPRFGYSPVAWQAYCLCPEVPA